MPDAPYIGRIAPSPTGHLHLGHARTFWCAWQRARRAKGSILLRFDDLDRSRCRPEFIESAMEDLKWLGLNWDGEPVVQSSRIDRYRAALAKLYQARLIYPCERSRRDVAEAIGAPHEGGEHDEPLYPVAWRPKPEASLPPLFASPVNWRFRVPDGHCIEYMDTNLGRQSSIAGRDFGDFLVWRKDDLPSYQLATVVDDIAMGVTEVVRGADLVRSTFRQFLLFEALAAPPPEFHHCPLMLDERGDRLAKRSDSLALRTLRARGASPTELVARFGSELA